MLQGDIALQLDPARSLESQRDLQLDGRFGVRQITLEQDAEGEATFQLNLTLFSGS
jgi:hypothetical protein